MKSIYLDHNSTTPIDPRVADAVRQSMIADMANPAGQHQAGRAVRRKLEACRAGIGTSMGADIDAVGGPLLVFTSGGTESNNLALLGMVGSPPGRVIVSAIEHPSVLAAAERLRGVGFDVRTLPVDESGVARTDVLEELLSDDTRLVSVMWGNHETGVIQPVERIARLCADRSVRFHCDAIQVVGKLPIDFAAAGFSSMAIAAHKFGGPRGIGALIVAADAQPEPILFGGSQQFGLRPGTETTSLAIGMRTALDLEAGGERATWKRLEAFRDRFESRITSALPDTVVVGRGAWRLPQTSNLSFPGLDRQALMMALDLAGVACSAGSSCASGSSEPSPVLLAMGLPEAVVSGALRFSLGTRTEAGEIDEASNRIIRVVNDLRHKKEARKTASPSRQ